jgi:regulator of protease activity HflC (stomatin/prohibitin superfamily)
MMISFIGPEKAGGDVAVEVGVSGVRIMPSMDLTSPANKLKLSLSFLLVLVVLLVSVLLSSLHKVDEGNVGVYFRFGALMEVITHPGIHYMLPFLTSMEQVQIRPQTDTLPPMASITRDGIQNIFKDVQIISRVDVDQVVFMVQRFGIGFRQALVYDRVKEELRIFCANNTIDDVYNAKFLDIVGEVKRNIVASISRLGRGGIEIMNLVIPKPDIPDDIAQNYMQASQQL